MRLKKQYSSWSNALLLAAAAPLPLLLLLAVAAAMPLLLLLVPMAAGPRVLFGVVALLLPVCEQPQGNKHTPQHWLLRAWCKVRSGQCVSGTPTVATHSSLGCAVARAGGWVLHVHVDLCA
jgi:hypothetical protein